jgi:hypothetical protein
MGCPALGVWVAFLKQLALPLPVPDKAGEVWTRLEITEKDQTRSCPCSIDGVCFLNVLVPDIESVLIEKFIKFIKKIIYQIY